MRFCAWCPMCKYSGILYDVSNSGPRVSILTLFPAVRWCEYWLERAIYSKAQGFLGGVSWALLVARICQLYPNSTSGTIVSRLFIIMYQWYDSSHFFLPFSYHSSSLFWSGLGHSPFSWSVLKKGRYQSDSGIPWWVIARSQSSSNINLFFRITLLIVLIECRSLLRRILPCAQHILSPLQTKWSLLPSLKEVWCF